MSTATRTARRTEKQQRREAERAPDPAVTAVLDAARSEWGDFVRFYALARPDAFAHTITSLCGGDPLDVKLAVLEFVRPNTPLHEVGRIVWAAIDTQVYEAPVEESVEDPAQAQILDFPEAAQVPPVSTDGLDELTLAQLRKLNTERGHPISGARILKKHTLVERLRAIGISTDG